MTGTDPAVEEWTDAVERSTSARLRAAEAELHELRATYLRVLATRDEARDQADQLRSDLDSRARELLLVQAEVATLRAALERAVSRPTSTDPAPTLGNGVDVHSYDGWWCATCYQRWAIYEPTGHPHQTVPVWFSINLRTEGPTT